MARNTWFVEDDGSTFAWATVQSGSSSAGLRLRHSPVKTRDPDCVCIRVCQANVAAAQQRCIRRVFIAIEIRKSAPGIRRQFLIDEKHLKEKQKKPLQDFFFLSFQWAFLVRSICWLVCVSELVWPRLLFRWWEIDYNTLGFTDFWTRFCLQMREQLNTDAWTLASISKTKVNSTLRLLCFFLSLWIALFFLKTFHGSLIMS